MSQIPPGPKWLRPVEFLQAGLTPPIPVLQRLAAKYGDPFRVSYVSGAVTFTGRPETLAAVYTADPDAFDVWGMGVIEPVFGTTSVVVSSGERHRRDRKLLTPAFNGSRMRAYGATIAECAARETAEWTRDRPFKMLEATQRITLDIMVRVVFGVQDQERIRQARDAVLELIASLNVLIFLFPFLRREFGGHGPWMRHRRAVDALNALLIDEIRARSGQTEAANDVLSLMVLARDDEGGALSEAEVLDHLRGLLFAGHEATATVLAWIFYWLHREPAVHARVMQEIDGLAADPDPDDCAALPYLEAVCKETLRLYPPVVDPARIARVPFEMAGYTVPAGEALRVSISLLHGRPELFPEPGRFRPERFLERKYSLFEYAPFGGGARRCMGQAFAMYEMKVILATVLQTQRLRLANDEPIIHARRGLTLGPKGGVPMVWQGRRPLARPAAATPVQASP